MPPPPSARKLASGRYLQYGKWGCTDSNREPSDYEPPALTVELHPRLERKDEGRGGKLEAKCVDGMGWL